MLANITSAKTTETEIITISITSSSELVLFYVYIISAPHKCDNCGYTTEHNYIDDKCEICGDVLTTTTTTTTTTPTVCDYYTPENEEARYPRPNSGSSQDTYQGNSSINYFDGSYIKLKNITFGYTLPSNILKAIKIEKARLYFTASNPFIWTKSKYLKNYDPEKGGNDDDAPLSKQFVFGVNLTF